MSTLTKEEKELRNSMPITGYRCTTHHFACHCINRGTMDLIDRLVAENEELRKKLTAIVDAAEQVLWSNSVDNLDKLNKAIKEAKGE